MTWKAPALVCAFFVVGVGIGYATASFGTPESVESSVNESRVSALEIHVQHLEKRVSDLENHTHPVPEHSHETDVKVLWERIRVLETRLLNHTHTHHETEDAPETRVQSPHEQTRHDVTLNWTKTRVLDGYCGDKGSETCYLFIVNVTNHRTTEIDARPTDWRIEFTDTENTTHRLTASRVDTRHSVDPNEQVSLGIGVAAPREWSPETLSLVVSDGSIRVLV